MPDDVMTISWVNPLDAALIELDVPVDFFEKGARGELPRRRFENQDAIARVKAQEDQIRAHMDELERPTDDEALD